MVITEIGGTVGDIESLPFLEAIRQFRQEVGRDNALFIHLTLVPYIAAAGELKTKPTQHSVRELMRDRNPARHPHLPHRAGPLRRHQAQDRALLQRGLRLRDREPRRAARSTRSRCAFHDQGLDRVVCERLGLDTKEPDLAPWEAIVSPGAPARAQGAHRGGRQVHRAPRRLQVGAGGAHSRRHRQRRRGRDRVDRERSLHRSGRGAGRRWPGSTGCWCRAASA